MGVKAVSNLIKKEYEKAVNLAYIRKPMAYAIYRVWKEVDRRELPRKVNDDAE